jgi:ankyrin repeat protein
MPTAEELIAAVNADDAERVAAIVAEDPALAMARDRDGVSAVMLSRYRFARPVTDALLAADPDLDVFEAATLGYADRLRACLADDPSLADAFSPDGFTALHLAAFFGKTESTRILLEAGASVNVYSRNDFGVEPLHSAAAGRHHEVCRLLVAAGADLDARQREDYTPLHEAAQHGDAELVELFLSAGADPTARMANGDTPADTAETAGHHDLATRLRTVAAHRG